MPTNLEGFKEVSKREFYAQMNVDVNPSIVAGIPYPYTQEWKLRSGRVIGKTVGYYPERSALPETKYYLKEA